jgi:hypothetical protein
MNRWEAHAEALRDPIREEQDAEQTERDQERRRVRTTGDKVRQILAHDGLQVAELQTRMTPTPAPPKDGATPYQRKAALLAMQWTAERYAQAAHCGAASAAGRLKRQLALIALREGELKAASPELWPLYERDREAERLERQAGRCAATAAEPAPAPAPKPAPAPPARPEPADKRTDLDRAVEELVRHYTCGDVCEAAWEASHRIYRPNQGARP